MGACPADLDRRRPYAGQQTFTWRNQDGDPGTTTDVILITTGTELGLAISAYEQLTADGVNARVVSMPSWELFDRQDQAYRDAVLPPSVTARVAIEQASSFGWHRWVGA